MLFALSCGGDKQTYRADDYDSSTPDPNATVTATPEPISAADSSKVYAVVDALRTGDIEAIRPHIGFRKIACSGEAAAGGPPACASGESDGDKIDAFYYATCEGLYLRPAEINQALDALPDMDFYGAYRIQRRTDSGYEYSIILEDRASTREGYAWEAILNNGEIIGLLFSCSLSPEDLLKARRYDALVPTPKPTVATPGT